MVIELRHHRFHGAVMRRRRAGTRYSLWVVVVDGRRHDSFLTWRRARQEIERLKANA